MQMQPHSRAHAGTGFINVGGWDPTGRDFSRIAPVSAPAPQGERVLHLGCCTGSIAIGQIVRLWMSDPGDGSLWSELHGGRAPVPRVFYGAPSRAAARRARPPSALALLGQGRGG